MDELISIIVPVYNVERFIEETIDCVAAQTYSRWELLLVEDGSSDRTVSIIEESILKRGEDRIRLIRQPENRGAALARNRGLKEAAGRYIAYLDADDLWVPEKLERELAFMREKDAAFAFTGYEFVHEDGSGTGKVVRVPETLNYRQALKNTTIFTTTVMFDTEKIEKSLLEMPVMKSEDTALWWKVLRNGYTAYGLDENLAKYRRSGKTLSSNKLEAVRRIWNLYRKAEGMGILSSAWHFCFWAVRAVRRRV
ncbi:MAG: glycosyltransferase [Butyrivibrio sp.]|nr:glycosyltransferase [Acetatifactor muris]MCM1559191.1 glycosyltransferase [Butyrivibrio sp.]